jgi:hypothetical protein
VGLLASYVERFEDPDEPVEALLAARRLADIYADRLYVALAFHGSPSDKVVNRGLLAIAQRLELGVVATNAVRFATPEDALDHTVLGAIRGGRRADGLLSQSGVGGDFPMLALDAIRAQAYLKSATAMWRLFGSQLPAALEATVEVAQRCEFRLPLAERTPTGERYGPARLFGLQPARQIVEQQLVDTAEDALPARCAETGREAPSDEMGERVSREVEAICQSGLAELLVVAQQVALECRRRGIPLVARGSATCSLVWALGLVEACPLDHDLNGDMFVHDGRPDLPDLDLEVPSTYEPVVAAFVRQSAAAPWAAQVPSERAELPYVYALRLGINVSLGSRQAVRNVGAALGLEAPRERTRAPGAAAQQSGRDRADHDARSRARYFRFAAVRAVQDDPERGCPPGGLAVPASGSPIGVHLLFFRPNDSRLAAGAVGWRGSTRPRPHLRCRTSRARRGPGTGNCVSTGLPGLSAALPAGAEHLRDRQRGRGPDECATACGIARRWPVLRSTGGVEPFCRFSVPPGRRTHRDCSGQSPRKNESRMGERMQMRFLMVHRIDETRPDAYSPSPEVIAAMGALMGEMNKAGVLLAAEGVQHSSKGAKVKLSEGKRTVTDGPFSEAKEVIGGFALVQVRSLDEAIEWASRFAETVGDVEVEVRQIAEFG